MGLDKQLYIPVVELFEGLSAMGLFTFEVLPKEEMQDKCGETFPKERVIHIREDIYEQACEGNGYARTTFCHELFHLIWHSESALSLCRTESERQAMRAYEDPEWQANCFAGEFLVNKSLVKDNGGG